MNNILFMVHSVHPRASAFLCLAKVTFHRRTVGTYLCCHEQVRSLHGKVESIILTHQDIDHIGSLPEIVQESGGIQAIFTPGHTPGHISLYLKQSKILVAGDSMFSIDGTLIGPHPESTPDMATAWRSLEKYLNYDIASVICYHGGLSNHNVNKQLRELIKKRELSPKH